MTVSNTATTQIPMINDDEDEEGKKKVFQTNKRERQKHLKHLSKKN